MSDFDGVFALGRNARSTVTNTALDTHRDSTHRDWGLVDGTCIMCDNWLYAVKSIPCFNWCSQLINAFVVSWQCLICVAWKASLSFDPCILDHILLLSCVSKRRATL